MATIDELVVKITADTAGIKKGLSSVNAKLSQTEKNAKRVSLAFKAIPILAVALALKSTAAELTNVQRTLDAMNAKMKAATGSAAGMRDGLAFVRAESERLGLDFVSSANAFGNFSAAALRAGVEMNVVKDTFGAVAEASTALNLSVADQSSVFQALSQIASKGVVSMEELRQQLGERLPVAFSAAAKGLGITQQELNKLVSSGSLLAKDFFPAFARGLREDMGEAAKDAADGLTQNINRMNNAFFDLKKGIVESGVGDAIGGVIGFIADLTTEINDFIAASDARKLSDFNTKLIELQDTKRSILSGDEDSILDKMLGRDPEAKLEHVNSQIKQLQDDAKAFLEAITPPDEEGGGNGGLSDKSQSILDEQALLFEEKNKLIEKQAGFDIKTQEDRARAIALIEAKKEKMIFDGKAKNAALAINLLKTLFGENKAFALAELALRKAIAISENIINTEVAAIASLRYDPLGGLATAIRVQGAVSTGLIAATGVAEAASILGGDSGGGSTVGGGSAVSASEQSQQQQVLAPRQTVNVNIDPDSLITSSVLIASINQGLEDGERIMLNGEPV